jgi:hypothetical protein
MATERDRFRGWVCALGALGMLWGCSSGGGGGGGGPATTHLSVDADLPVALKSVAASAGASQVASIYTVPAALGAGFAVTDGSVDLAATLAGASNVVLKASRKAGGPAGALGAAGDSVATLTVRVGPESDIANVCTTGYTYGPFEITESASGGLLVDTPTVTASRQTLSVINTGSAAVCMIIDAARDVAADFDTVSADVITCDEDAATIGGDWEGTYTCNNFGGCPDEGGAVSIVLYQDPGSHSASYTSDAESFAGTVCGNQFAFDGGVDGAYDESGTFTLTVPGKAKKHSQWHDVSGTCGGTCDDVLHQIAAF